MCTATLPGSIRRVRSALLRSWVLGAVIAVVVTHLVATCHTRAEMTEAGTASVAAGHETTHPARMASDCTSAIFNAGHAVLEHLQDASHPDLLAGVVTLLGLAAVVSRQIAGNFMRAPPSHARRLASLCVLRT